MAIIIRAKGVGITRAVARIGDSHNCHKIINGGVHGGGPIFTGSSFVKTNNLSTARQSDKAHCHPVNDHIAHGVPNITIDGLQIATVGDKCAHGGVILEGSPNVFVGETLGCTTSFPDVPNVGLQSLPAGKHWIQG